MLTTPASIREARGARDDDVARVAHAVAWFMHAFIVVLNGALRVALKKLGPGHALSQTEEQLADGEREARQFLDGFQELIDKERQRRKSQKPGRASDDTIGEV